MGAYSYVVSRYVPNQIRDEAVNIGIVVVDPDTGKTASRFMDNLRGLKARCPGADLRSLEGIVRSIRVGDMPGGADDLARLAEVHTYSLQFTDPRAVLAPTLKDALGDTFDIFVGEPAAPRPAPERAAAGRSRLLAKIDAEVSRSGMAEEALIRQPEFAGSRGVFRPDRALRGGGGAIALHALSFAAQPWRALKDAKVLAIDYEDAAARAADLKCAAIVEPIPGGASRGDREMYEQAAGHLRDKDCEVIRAGRMPAYVMGIARRLGRTGGAGGGRSRRRAAPGAGSTAAAARQTA